MKILHTSDNHIDFFARKLGNTKYERGGSNIYYKERIELTRSIIQDGVNRKVGAIVVSGDFHNKTKPPPQELADAYKIFDSVPSSLPVIIICGNHDESTSRGSALHPLVNRRPNIHVFLSLGFFNCGGIPIIAAPWNTPYENIRHLRRQFIKDVVLVHHVGVLTPGMNWGETGGEVGTITVEQLQDLNCIVTMLGHYHGQTFFTPDIAYAGSPEYFRFDEENQTKGYLIWDLEKQTAESVITKTTPFKTYQVEEFLSSTNIDNTSFIRVKGMGIDKEKEEVLKKLKSLGCPGYKLDIGNPLKYRRLFTLKTTDNITTLRSYLENKNISPIDELLELDQKISKAT